MAFCWRADNGLTLNSGFVALWFVSGYGPVLLRNPIFCDFSGGEGGPDRLPPPWIRACKGSQVILSKNIIWAGTCGFQQCGILTSVDSDEPMQHPFNPRNSKWCSVSSLTVIAYPSDLQRLWSVCAYAQADLKLCWSHIPHCWKSHAAA